MNHLDFYKIHEIISDYYYDNKKITKITFFKEVFKDYLASKKDGYGDDILYRYMNGDRPFEPALVSFYVDDKAKGIKYISERIEKEILPILYNSPRVIDLIKFVILTDNDIHQFKKEQLLECFKCKNIKDEATAIAEAIVFAITRKSIPRDTNTGELLHKNVIDFSIDDVLKGVTPPKPCKYFVGREEELNDLHEKMLYHNDKVFIRGIPGIGKSEFVKAYANMFRKDYSCIIYIQSSGNLAADICNLDFIDDDMNAEQDMIFDKHKRFLTHLPQSSLLIVDRFEYSYEQQDLLEEIMNYECHVIFTTCNYLEEYECIELKELSRLDDLLAIFSNFCPLDNTQNDVIVDIIERVYKHTLLVEMSARLLNKGIYDSKDLLNKLNQGTAILNSKELIYTRCRGKRTKGTYPDLIDKLLELFNLSEAELEVMNYLVVAPITGIEKRRFARWISLEEMNVFNELIEKGVVRQTSDDKISLHPLIKDATINETNPSIKSLSTLMYNLMQNYGKKEVGVPLYKDMFLVTENILKIVLNNDTKFYWGFLVKTFNAMKKLHYLRGMQLVNKKMYELLDETTFNQAIYFNSVAAIAKEKNDYKEALVYTDKALDLIENNPIGHLSMLVDFNVEKSMICSELNDDESASKCIIKALDLVLSNGLQLDDTIITQVINMTISSKLKEPTVLLKLYRELLNCRPIKESVVDFCELQKTLFNICDNSYYANYANEHNTVAKSYKDCISMDEIDRIQEIEMKNLDSLENFLVYTMGVFSGNKTK